MWLPLLASWKKRYLVLYLNYLWWQAACVRIGKAMLHFFSRQKGSAIKLLMGLYIGKQFLWLQNLRSSLLGKHARWSLHKRCWIVAASTVSWTTKDLEASDKFSALIGLTRLSSKNFLRWFSCPVKRHDLMIWSWYSRMCAHVHVSTAACFMAYDCIDVFTFKPSCFLRHHGMLSCLYLMAISLDLYCKIVWISIWSLYKQAVLCTGAKL